MIIIKYWYPDFKPGHTLLHIQVVDNVTQIEENFRSILNMHSTDLIRELSIQTDHIRW